MSKLKTVNYKVVENIIRNKNFACSFCWNTILSVIAGSIAMLLLLLILLLEGLETWYLHRYSVKMITETTNEAVLKSLLKGLKVEGLMSLLRLLIWRIFHKNDNGKSGLSVNKQQWWESNEKKGNWYNALKRNARDKLTLFLLVRSQGQEQQLQQGQWQQGVLMN